MSTSTENVEAILGGRNKLPLPLSNRMNYIAVARSGLTRENFDSLRGYTQLDLKTLALLLAITPRTIQRKKKQEKFQPEISERMLSLAEVYAEGMEVFGNRDSLTRWMESPCQALGGKTPLSLLDTQFGREMVTEELGRMLWGVFS